MGIGPDGQKSAKRIIMQFVQFVGRILNDDSMTVPPCNKLTYFAHFELFTFVNYSPFCNT